MQYGDTVNEGRLMTLLEGRIPVSEICVRERVVFYKHN